MSGKNLNDNELDELIRRELLSVSAPAELRQKLLQPDLLAPRARGWFGLAANDSVLRRLLPVAASLVIALGIAFFSTDLSTAFSASHDALADEIFSHIYLEGQLDNADAAVLPLATVNTRLKHWTGAHLKEADMEDLKVTFAKDCWVAKRVAFHMIMKGETGAITVMMIPNEGAADSEFKISDDTYSGLVTPTDGGYLVVIGNKREPLTAYRNLLSGKLEWEY